MGGFFFSLRQEVICSVQQAFCWEGFLRSVSHALALSRQAGRQQSVESICSSFAVSVIIDNIDLPLFSHFLDFWSQKPSAAAAASPLETKQAAPQHWQPLRDLFSPSSSSSASMLRFHGLCLYISLWRIGLQLWISLRADWTLATAAAAAAAAAAPHNHHCNLNRENYSQVACDC